MEDSFSRLADLGWYPPPLGSDGVHHLSTSDRPSVSYPLEGLEVLGLEGGSGYWFDHRASAVATYLERLSVSCLWEIGAGTGAMAKRLQQVVPEVIAVEPLESGAQAAANLGLTAICGSLEGLRLPESVLDCIGLFDVLEHLEHPEELLTEAYRVVRRGGCVVVTVPAFGWLWGDEDDAAGHHRRYTAPQLDALMLQCGFARIRSEYLFASLVPPALAMRAIPYRLGRRSEAADVLASMRSQLELPALVDGALARMLNFETRVAGHLRLPFGLSVLGAYRRLQ